MESTLIIEGTYYEQGYKMGQIFKKALAEETAMFLNAIKKEETVYF